MSSTTVTVVGNCVREPELRYSQSGTPVASTAVAVTARRKNANGQWEDGDTAFYDVTCFGRLGENAAESVTKGARIVVTGKLKQSSWEKDGVKRSKVEIIADDLGVSLFWDPISGGNGASTSRPKAATLTPDDEPF